MTRIMAPPPAPAPAGQIGLHATPSSDAGGGGGVSAAWPAIEYAGFLAPPDADFFAAAPPEIGPVRWAQTTLKLGRQHWPMLTRLALALLCGPATGAVTAFLLVRMNHRNRYPTMDADLLAVGFLGPCIVLAGFAAVMWFTRFRHTCCYAGRDGVVRYALRGGRHRAPRAELLLFRNAAELRTKQVRHSVNGIYTGTRYSFRWTDANGSKLLHLKGTHTAKDGLPARDDPFHFALAAEGSWTEYMLEHVNAQLARLGYAEFSVKHRQAVRVGSGFLEFHFGGEVQRVRSDEIAHMRLVQGAFLIRHKDAGWFSRRGKFSFEYGNMANVRLFLVAFENLLGYHFN